MKRTNRIMSMLLAVVMVVCMLPVSVFAADAATIENNGVIRYSETKAEVSFYPTSYDSQLDWQYYYIVTEQDAEKTADDVKNSGTAHEFDEEVSVATFDVTNLASGVSYIHIVLVQKDNAEQVSNVLTLEIPEYVPLTITPSAQGYELESGNTLTVVVGTTVTFTTSESGCGMEYKENTTVGPELVGSEGYSRTATFSELGTYTIVASIDYKTAECTVVVVPEIHQHNYPEEWSSDATGHWKQCPCGEISGFAEHTSSGEATVEQAEVCTVCGYEIAPATGYTLTLNYAITSFSGVTAGTGSKAVTGIGSGEVVDLSQYWPNELIVTGSDGKTYYFADFVENSDGSGDILNSVTMDSDKTLYACWSIEKQITVLLDPNGGSLPYRSTRVSELSYADISYMNSVHKPVRSGYDFAGWSLEQDEMADDNDTVITDNCTLYAVWQSGSDEPPATDVPVKIGGDYDAILRDGMVIVQGEDPISGTLDLGKTNAEAIQLPYASVEKSAIERTEATILFPGGTSATLTGPAWTAAKDALKVGEDLQISVEDVGAEVLPDSLTEKEPFEDDEVLFYSEILISGAVVFTEQELLDLGVISNDDDDITWEELKYLYHYMTTAELRSLGWFIEDFLADFIDPQIQAWIAEMIERDAVTPLNIQELMNMADLTDAQFEFLADMELNDPTIGQLRQAGFTLEQMKLLQSEVKKLSKGEASADIKEKYDALLDWLDDAIAQKEPENEDTPKYVQVTGIPDGENPYFVAAVDVNMFAVRADGTTVPVTIRADRSDAVAWSTNIDSAWLEEKIAEMKNATGTNVAVRAYKVLENGRLEAKVAKVIVNDDGTLTASALSNGNSTYVFLLEPEQADVDDTPTTPEIPDSPQTGDNSHMLLWFGLMLTSGFALAGTWIYGRKRRTN